MRITEDTPRAILFACTQNAVRSPMAAALMRHLAVQGVHVESAGVAAGELDRRAVAAMAELGIALSAHRPRRFEDVGAGAFDLVVTLSPEAEGRARTLGGAVPVEYWPLPDPTICDGSREQRLAGYRAVRDALLARLQARFGDGDNPA